MVIKLCPIIFIGWRFAVDPKALSELLLSKFEAAFEFGPCGNGDGDGDGDGVGFGEITRGVASLEGLKGIYFNCITIE